MQSKALRPASRRLLQAARFLPLLALPLGTMAASAAASTGNATVTGTAVSGSLFASYPLAISLVSASIGTPSASSLSVPGGAVLVEDLRGSAGGTWTTTATLTNFTDVLTSTHVIPSSSVSVNPGAAVSSVANSAGTTATAGGVATFTTPTTAVTLISATGTGQGIFGLNPTFTWTIPANAYTGGGTVYTATMAFTTQ